MRRTFQKIANIFAFIAFVYLACKAYIQDLFNLDTPFLVVIIFMILLSSYLLVEKAWNTYRLQRLSKYPEALEPLTMAFAQIHYIMEELEPIDISKLSPDQTKATEKHIMRVLTHACNALTNVFGMITGYKCSVCIKTLEINKKRIRQSRVFTLVRDENSEDRATPDDRALQRQDQTIWNNTDFDAIVEQEVKGVRDIFISNALPFLHQYENSSFQIYGEPWPIKKGLRHWPSKIRRWLTWPLPYKSTIVVPIKPKLSFRDPTTLGFVCVDCKKMFVFRTYYDKYLLNGFSDGIYSLMKKFHELRD